MGLDLKNLINEELNNKSNNKNDLSLSTLINNEIETKPATDIQLGQFGVGKSQYDTNITPNKVQYLEYIRGARQPWYDKAANGVVNMSGRIATSAAEGILNPFVGTFYAIKDGKLSSYIDNPFTQLIDSADEQIKAAVPFYQTEEEQNAHGLSKLLYANTYFRDVLDGVGFSLGAMATGGAYSKAINALGKTALVGKAGDFVNKLNTIDSAPDKLKYIVQVNTLNNIKDGAKKGLIAGFTATAESEMNARSDAKEFKESLIKEITDTGRQPSIEELNKIDQLSEEILTSSFALNMPIIMLDNWIVFGKSVFGNKVTDKTNLIGEQITKEGFADSYKLAKKTSIDKILDKTYGVRKFVEPMIAEGFFQEQSQYGITKGVNDYYKKKFYNPEAADFISSFGEGVYQAYGTKEGWDNGIIGALSGGLMGNVTSLSTQGLSAYKDPNNITSIPSKLSNLSTVKTYKTLIEKAMRHGNLMQEQKTALKNNDTFSYENAKNDDFINYVSTKITFGKTEDLINELNEFKSMSEEEFKSNFGNELSTDEITKHKQTVSQFVQEKINKVQQIKRAYDIINERFPNASEGNKERLAYASLTIDNAKERKKKLNEEAKQLLTKNIHFTGNLGDTNPLMLLGNDYLSLTKENRKLYIKALLDANMNPMDLNEALDKFVDIDKLEKREEQFVKEYKELLKPHVQTANDIVDKKAENKIVEEQSKEEELVDETFDDESIDFNELVNKAVTNRELDKILEQADKEGLTNPELIDLISKKRESLKPVNTNVVQLNKDEEEFDETEEPAPDTVVEEDEELSDIDNQLYPNVKEQKSLTYKPNKLREELHKATKGELLSSTEVNDLIAKEGANINSLITIDAINFSNQESFEKWNDFNVTKGTEMFRRTTSEEEYFSKKEFISIGKIQAFSVESDRETLKGVKIGNNWYNKGSWYDLYTQKSKKSVRVKVGDKVLGYFQDAEYNSPELNQLIAGINIGDELSNAEVKALGFNLNISDGYIKPSDTPIAMSELNDVVKTNNDYIIFDQGSNKFRAEGNSAILIRDANGAINAGDIEIPYNQRRLGRYILVFTEPVSGKKKYVPIYPAKIKDYKSYIKNLIELSNKIIKGDESGKFTDQQISDFNTELNDEVFIAVKNNELEGRSINVEFNIDKYGNLRVNIVEAFYNSKIPDNPIYKLTIKNSELPQFKDENDLLTYINDLTTSNAGVSIDADSFRQSVPTGELTGSTKSVGNMFQTYTAPEVLEGQDVIISVNKLDASANTITPEAKPVTISSLLDDGDIKETTSKEIDEFDVDTNTAPKKDDDGETPVFKLIDNKIDNIIDSNEISEVERIVPEEIPVQVRKDIKSLVKNVAKNKTPWGFFKNKIIYLWDEAGSGTGYHEAFHAIFRYAISDKEVDTYLKLAKKEVLKKLDSKEKVEKAINELRNSSTDYINLSDKQMYSLLLEEHVADRFMEWKKNKDLNTSIGLKQLFKRLFNLIKELVRINDSLESLFDKIDRGAFHSTKTVPNKQAFVTEIVYKNLISGVDTHMSSTKSKKIINTFAARVKKESRKPENSSLSLDDILEKLIQERIINLESKGKEYIKSVTEPVLRAKLLQAYKEEIYLLKNKEAKELLVEQVNKRLKLFDNRVVDGIEEDENDEGENNDKGGEDGFGSKEAWTISLEEGTNKVIKEYIAFAMYETIDELTNEPVLISVDNQTIYNGLGHVLANTPEDQIMNRFITYAKDNEQAKAVLDMIMDDTGMSYNEKGLLSDAKKNFNDLRKIITAFKNVKVTFLHTGFKSIFNENGELAGVNVIVGNANTNTANKISISEWSNNLFNIKNKNQTNKKFWETRINNIVNSFKRNRNNIITEEELNKQIKEVQNAFKAVGIKLSSGYLRYSILSYKEQFNSLSEEQLNDITPFKDDIKPLDLLSIYGEPSGYSLGNYLANDKDPYEEGKEGMGGRMKEIAAANGVFDESLASSNFKGADGNTRYDIIKSSYVLDEAIRLRNKGYRDNLIKKYEILKDNLLLKNDAFLNKLVINLIDGVRDQSKSDNEGKSFGDFSEREYLMQHIGYWFAQTDKGNANFLFRQNEASNTAYVAEMPINKYTSNNIISDDAVNTVYNFFKAEYNRIARESAKGLGNIKGYNDKETGRAFRFTEFANLVYTIGPAKYNQITENAKINEPLSDELVNDVKKAIKKSLENQIKEFKKLLAENKLITLENGKAKPSSILPNRLKGKVLEGLEFDSTLAEMYLNDYINSFSLNQLFDGDYALSRDDKGVKEIEIDGIKVLVPKQDLGVDIVKRNKGAMGSGSDLGTGNHRVAFIKDINVFVDGKKDGQLIRSDKGDKINSNDAQSYTNINHIMFMTERFGRMSDDIRSILRKIRRGVDITKKQQEKLESAGVSLNPWKTVTFGREFYIKTSEALISRHEVSYITDKDEYNKLMDELEFMEDTKELTKEALIEFNKELITLYKPIPGKEYYHTMLNQMDLHGIDQIVAESASKGMTLTPVDSLADNMNLSLAMIDIPNSYKRLQVETPTGKEVITAGTQLMQLIDSEQKDAVEVIINDKTLTIGEVRKQYRDAMSKTRNNSFKLAEAYIRKNADGTTDTSNLKKKFLKSLESAGADDQLLEIFELNWNLLPAIDKAEQLFLAHFGGGVLAQKVPGTKVSLMSDAHWNVIRDENGKVVLNKTVKANPEKYKVDPENSKLKHNVRDPKTGQLYSECILSERVFSKFGLNIGDEIPVDVATMLGYRIPTQDKHSMISLRVVDVLPNYLEGTGIFPAEIVLLSGADFDIDSLFIQQPAFWMNNGKAVKSGTETSREERWTSFLNYILNNKIFDTQFQIALNNSKEYKELSSIKKKKKEESERLKTLRTEIRNQTLAYFKLPVNESEFNKLYKDGIIVNNNTLNNDVLDTQLALLTNKAMEDIALQPVTSDPLVEEAKYIESLKEGSSKTNNSASSLLGKAKAFFQNSAGKAGIGPVANALQAFTFLAKNNISRTGDTSLIINDKELSKFDYTNEEDGRVADTLSTVLSVMTDNAKDPIAGKMGLTLEILTAYNYLISLGVPLRTATLIINTPSIQMYAKLLKENKYSLKTDAEKKGTSNEKLATLFSEIKGETVDISDVSDMRKNVKPINTESLEQVIKEGLNDTNRELNLDLLITFLQIESESKYFGDLNNLIKLTKGLPTSFTDVDKGMIDSLYKLGLNKEYGLPERNLDEEITPPFDVREAVKNDNLLNENINLALQVMNYAKDVFITETKQFKQEFDKLILNLKSTLSKDDYKEIKRSFLGFISTKAYVKYMQQYNADFKAANDDLLFPQLGGETLAKELIKLKNSSNESISNNAFIRWLKPELNISVEDKSSTIFDKVSGKSFIKLSTESINDIVNSFADLLENPQTKQFAINSFHYLISKDNLEYKNDSFVKYLAPRVFNSVSKGLNLEMKNLMLGMNSSEFENNAKEFRLLLASGIPTQSYLKQVKLPATVKVGEEIVNNEFKDEMSFNFGTSRGLFDSRTKGETIEYKYTEYIIIRIGKKTNLYYNDLLGKKEDWSGFAIYKRLPSFGFKSISLFGKDYFSNYETYSKLDQLKKEDKKGIEEKNKEDDEFYDKILINSKDALATKIPKEQNKPSNNLDNSEKSSILYIDEKTNSGIPISELYDEETWNSFSEEKKDKIKKCN